MSSTACNCIGTWATEEVDGVQVRRWIVQVANPYCLIHGLGLPQRQTL
jgi:hypothetical protein